MLQLASIIVLAILNRARGDDAWKDHIGLPGRALFYIAPGVAVVTLVNGHPLPAALAFGVAYLLWGLGPWGFLYDPFGTYQPANREVDRATAWLLKALDDNKPLAFWFRNLTCWPGLIAVSYLAHDPFFAIVAPIFAAGVVAVYGLAWKLFPKQPILTAELATGALWGALILI